MGNLTPVGQLVGDSWKLMRERWVVYVKCSLIFIAAVIVVVIVFGGFGMATGVAHLLLQNSDYNAAWGLGTLGFGFLLLILAIILIIIGGTIVKAATTYIFGVTHVPTVKEALGVGWKKFWPFLWTSILSALIIIIGLILFIIPGLVFLVWYFFATYIVLFEGESGWTALQKSKKYVQGRFWPLAGRLALLIGGAIVVSLLSQGIFRQLSGLVSWLLIGPFATAYTVKLYEDFKRTHAPGATQ